MLHKNIGKVVASVALAVTLVNCSGGGSSSGDGSSNNGAQVKYRIDADKGPYCYNYSQAEYTHIPGSHGVTTAGCIWYCASYRSHNKAYVLMRAEKKSGKWRETGEPLIRSGLCELHNPPPLKTGYVVP